MVIYFGVTKFQLLRALIHRLTQHKDDYAVLVARGLAIPDRTQSGIFDLVINYKSLCIYNETRAYDTVEEFEDKVRGYFDALMEQHSVDLLKATHVYVGAPEMDFSTYVSLKGIRYYYLEDANGTLTKWEYAPSKRGDNYCPAYKDVRLKYGLNGAINSLVISKYCSFSANLQNDPNWYDDKAVDYDVVSEAQKLSSDEKTRIFETFGVDGLRECNNLLLTQWFKGADGVARTDDEIPLRYQILVDYCLNNTDEYPVIKPHPNDRVNYKKHFPNCLVLDSAFPSELFAITPGITFRKIIGIDTASVFSLSKIADEVVSAGKSYGWNYKMFHKSLIVSEMINHLEYVEMESLFHFGGMGNLLVFLKTYVTQAFSAFALKWEKLNDISQDGIYIINDIEREFNKHGSGNMIANILSLSKESVAFFLDTHHLYPFYDVAKPYLIPFIVPVRIRKTAIRENIISDTNDEYVFAFTKDTETRKKLMSFRYERTLLHTGIKLSVTPTTQADADEILSNITSRKDPLQNLSEYLVSLEKRVQQLEASLNKTT